MRTVANTHVSSDTGGSPWLRACVSARPSGKRKHQYCLHVGISLSCRGLLAIGCGFAFRRMRADGMSHARRSCDGTNDTGDVAARVTDDLYTEPRRHVRIRSQTDGIPDLRQLWIRASPNGTDKNFRVVISNAPLKISGWFQGQYRCVIMWYGRADHFVRPRRNSVTATPRTDCHRHPSRGCGGRPGLTPMRSTRPSSSIGRAHHSETRCLLFQSPYRSKYCKPRSADSGIRRIPKRHVKTGCGKTRLSSVVLRQMDVCRHQRKSHHQVANFPTPVKHDTDP